MEKIQPYLIPVSIIIAGLLIATAVILTGQVGGGGQQVPQGPDLEAAKKVAPVTAADHIRGSQNAKVTLIEYSDFECPFCSRFHPTIQQALKEYDGKVKWVYRHMPLTQIHAQAEPSANAAECVAALGGNEAFWKMADGLFNNQTALSTTLYEKLAIESGVSLAAFRTCFTNKQYQSRIDSDVANALEAGGTGTPFTIIVAEGKDPQVIEGAQPYEAVKAAIEIALQ